MNYPKFEVELDPTEALIVRWALPTLDCYIENLSDDQRRCAECGGQDWRPESFMNGTFDGDFKDACRCLETENKQGMFNWFGFTGELKGYTLIFPVGPGTVLDYMKDVLECDFEDIDQDTWESTGGEGVKPDKKFALSAWKKIWEAYGNIGR